MKVRGAWSIIVLLMYGTASSIAYAFDPFSAMDNVPASPAKEMVHTPSTHAPCELGSLVSPVDLFEVVERALCHNPDTRQAWANVKAQAAQLGVTSADYLPSMDAALGVSRSEERTLVKRYPYLSTDPHMTTQSRSIDLSWTLFDFGLRSAMRENARQLLNAATATHDLTLQTVLMNAAQSYYDLLSAQGALEASRESERFAQESFRAAEAKYAAGAGALADKLQAQTTYAQARRDRVKAEGDLKNAHGALAVTMGLEANTAFAIAANERDVSEAPLLASVDALIDEAKRNHPSLIAAQAQWQAARANLDATKAEGLPSVILTGSLARNNEVGQMPADTVVRNRSIGVQLKIPLFEGFARQYRIQAAQADIEAKEAAFTKQQLQTSLDVWTSYQAWQTESEDLRATEELLRSAAQSFEVAQGRYKAGVGSMLELLNAQSALANARMQRIQAQSLWHTARLKLAASLGRLGVEDLSR